MQITTSGLKVTVIAQTITINGENRSVSAVSTAVAPNAETYLFLNRDGSLDRRSSPTGTGYLAARLTSGATSITSTSTTAGQIALATTNATPTAIPDPFGQLQIPINSVGVFEGYVTAFEDDAATAQVYYVRAAVRQVATAATASLVGTPLVVAYEDTAGCDLGVTADTTNGGIILTATGNAGDNLSWVADIKKVAHQAL